MAGASITLHPKAKAQGFSARFVCLTGKTVKGGMHPIRLQLIHNLKVKRFSTGEACTVKEWDMDAGRVKPRAKSAAQVNRVLNAMEAEVAGIVDALVVHGTLSLETFEARYRNPKASADVLAYMEALATKYTKEGRIGYAGTFRTAAAALGRLTNGAPIRFADLTASKLEELEAMLKEEGNTGGGIAAYMRTIRVAVNTAIKEGHMAADQYPFETSTHAGYSMKRLKSTARPRALDAKDMDKLKQFPFDEAPHLAESVRYFLFSYYSDGMNFQDMARLKPENLQGGRIFYARKKTGRPINIPVDEVLSDILAAFGHEGPYLFPILNERHATEQQQWDRIRKCLKRVNMDLKEAAKLVGIRTNLTTYVARHSAFTTLYRNGVALEHISEIARHSSPAVTQLYLRSLGADVLDEARKKLR
jgi:integrase/recombinase XerD